MKISRTPRRPLDPMVPIVSRDRVRTSDHARRAGRTPPEITPTEDERAKRELTGESDPDRQEASFTFSDEVRVGPETKAPAEAGGDLPTPESSGHP